MNDRPSRASQVGLFSEQISEQIGRLRVLTGSDADRTGGVALKRAVMATRLLAGSARILHVQELVAFLEELLVWLQEIGRSERRATPTQSLILDAVISFEEGLMRRLEQSEEAIEVSSFEEEIADLRGLIRKNRETMLKGGRADGDAAPPQPQAAEEPEAAQEPQPQAAEEPGAAEVTPTPAPAEEAHAPEPAEAAQEPQPQVVQEPQPAEATQELEPQAAQEPEPAEQEPTGEQPSVDDDEVIVEAMGRLAEWIDELDPQRRDELRGDERVRRRLHHLHAALDRLLEGLPEEKRPRKAGPHPPSSWIESDHPMVRELAWAIQSRAQVLQGRLEYRIQGEPGEIDEVRWEKLVQVLDRLVEDALEVLQEMLHEEDAPPSAHLSVVFETGEDRLRIAIRDDGPLLGSSPALDRADPLGLYRGLRRSRALIEELHGIILVEPADQEGTRFVLSLPRDASRPVVRVLDLGRTQAAVPALLLDEVISTEGLLFHRDTDGEHFMRNGNPVPLVDLAAYVGGLEPLAEEATTIAIVGSVEKRLGIYCHGVGEVLDSSETAEVPADWRQVSKQSIRLESGVVPLLSVQRLLQLRLTIQLVEEAGSVQDPILDAYLPSGEDGLETPTPTPGTPSAATAPGTPSAATAQGTSSAATEPDAASPKDTASPAAPSSTPSSQTEPSREGVDAREAPSGQEAARVLLINQSEFRRRQLKRTLEGMGYTVSTAADLQEGLQILSSEPFNLVVTDLRLGGSGVAGLSDLHRIRPELTVVLSSSVAPEYAEELARRAGADGCWLDPYRPEDLLRILPARR